jgi:F-type H+-transporting ATPase subunit delta
MTVDMNKISESLTSSIVEFGNTHEVERELLEFVKVYESNTELRQTLSSESLPFENRLAVVNEIVEGSLRETKAVLSFLVAAELSAELPEIVRKIINNTASHRGANVAYVTSAKELSKEQINELKDALEKSTDRKIDVHVNVDETILGGLSVELGETSIDGTLVSRLNQIKTK